MNKILLALTGVCISLCGYAQKPKPLSPQAEIAGTVHGTNIEIIYCRPSARGRDIMGGLVPYREVWRTGANAATTIEFSEDVRIEGKKLPAGKYELFTIPTEESWTIIFQHYANQWGAFSYKQKNDALRVHVKPAATPAFVETFTMTIVQQGVQMEWENTRVFFSVK